MELRQPPKRPIGTFTWETRIEPQVMAAILDWTEQRGLVVKTKSELLRSAAHLLVDLLEQYSDLKRFASIEEAMKRLQRSGLVDIADRKSFSSKPATSLELLMAREDGFSGITDKMIARYSRQERKAEPVRAKTKEEIEEGVRAGIVMSESREEADKMAQEAARNAGKQYDKVMTEEDFEAERQRRLKKRRADWLRNHPAPENCGLDITHLQEVVKKRLQNGVQRPSLFLDEVYWLLQHKKDPESAELDDLLDELGVPFSEETRRV
jgi:hypothetical protein